MSITALNPAATLESLAGWQRRAATIGLALTAGLLAAFAHPPFGFLPGLLGYPLLMWLCERTEGKGRLRAAFWYGWLAGFAYFGVGTWWVAEAFLVDARQAWMAPFAASLMPAGLGLFWGAAMAAYRKIAPAHAGRVLVFAGTFTLFEWLRGHVLSGFPWNLPGETWRAGSPVSQTASLVGAYGLTWLTLFVAASFVPLLAGRNRTRILTAAAGAVVLALMLGFGAVRLAGAVEQPTSTLVRIVQADVPQEDKWDEAAFRAIVERYVRLTRTPPRGRHPDIVIWPEGALPAAAEQIFAPGAWTAPAITGSLQPGQTLLMGTYRAEVRGQEVDYYNSLVAFTRTPAGLRHDATYDKHRLVPFGEFMPLDELMEATGIKALTHVGDGFSSGPWPRPLTVPGRPPMQPLICYEGLFPELAGNGPRPAWIVNISNDAWFGRTSGPLQHLNLSSYRAIEQGLPIVRATPTGVSAVIDAHGRIDPKLRLDAGEAGVIDAPLPAALENTYFSRIGDWGAWALIVISLLFAAPIRRLLRQARQ